MLRPESRVLLADSLRPPAGYTLDRAVATTFTLDLASALSVPLAFAAYEVNAAVDPISVIECVRQVSDRIDVFCQAGQIAVPSAHSDLVSFLEPMVHAVRRPRSGKLFHPKIWLLRYLNEDGAKALRLLILSRNLTDDRSWDVCARLDGAVSGRRRAGNTPIANLINELPNWAVTPLSAARTEGISSLVDDLRRAEWDLPEGVQEVTFHAFGIRGSKVPDFTGDRLLAISPFCNEGGLDLLGARGRSKPTTLVSRQTDLDRLPDGYLDGAEVLVLSELAGLDSEEGNSDRRLVGLHAKVVIVEQGRKAMVYLGSANATDAAFGGNAEVLVELEGKRREIGIDKLIGAQAPFRALLEPYDRRPAEFSDDDELTLRNLLRDVASVLLTARVSGRGADVNYSMTVRSKQSLPNLEGARIAMELLTRPAETRELQCGQPVNATFEALDVTDVTPFLKVVCSDDHGNECSTVVRAELLSDPADRLDRLLARQVDTPEKFLRFLSMLLGLVDFGAGELGGGDSGRSSGSWSAQAGSGIFEPVLLALAKNPAALGNLDRLVARLEVTEEGQAVLPEGFTDFWKIVRQVLDQGEAMAP